MSSFRYRHRSDGVIAPILGWRVTPSAGALAPSVWLLSVMLREPGNWPAPASAFGGFPQSSGGFPAQQCVMAAKISRHILWGLLLTLWKTGFPTAASSLEHRKGKTPDGGALTTDWLALVWADDELTAGRPCAEQPCLHRVLARCSHDQVVPFANAYGLLTATGKPLHPEPVDTWHREIRALRNATALWDAIAANDGTALRRALPQHQAAKWKALLGLAREHLARAITEKVAGGRLELVALPDEEPPQFTIRYRPAKLIDAIWQRFAEEIAGVIACNRCPAPDCGRWFPRGNGRSDRQFCSHACQMRAWRVNR
jgi:hypothetical protein